MRAGVLALGWLLSGSACQSASAPRPEGSARSLDARPPPAALARQSGLSVKSQIEISGLSVASGTIEGASADLWGFSDLRVDLTRTRLEIVGSKRGAALDQLLPEHALAVVNGGYFEPDFKPSSWLKSGGAELAPKSDTSKGGLLAVRGSSAYVGSFDGLKFEPELAVQSYPLIVEPEGRPGIHRDDGRRAARTVVCLAGGALHLIVIAAPRGEGPTLYESVALLRDPPPRGFGCTRALNLDGGASSGVVFGPSVPARQRPPTALVAYGLALLPR